MPALRRRSHHPLREDGQRHRQVPLPRLREDVHPHDGDDIRLVQDTALGMDGVPPPPIRVPLRQDGRQGQQERRFHRQILASQGVQGASRHPGSHRPAPGRRHR